ncbi:MAG: 3-deoxy-7-phosphoheptulonate synthase [Clostridioides sp.]|jgi:3-deoxy-7-phosphoheptulonate synthase|nr:3-deoxy-7-phosphoheptulonate synthase [Clostridioides sp.]
MNNEFLDKFARNDVVIKTGNIVIDMKKDKLIIAGPCAIESYEQLLDTALFVKKSGANVLRGGAFKPRTYPESFQGLGDEGLKILKQVKQEVKIPVITEIMDVRDLEKIIEAADIIQIGSRNMQNFTLLKEVGNQEKPVLLKRGLSATIKEWIGAAEYIANEGNTKIIMCERGIRTFSDYTRNTLDLSAVPIIKKETGLPIVVDPSHSTGIRYLVKPMSLAAIASGADGLMIEVHPHPEEALSDGTQSLNFEEFSTLMESIQKI